MPSSDREVPYISVVVVAQNGVEPDRLKTFAESWRSQSERFGLSSELIAVVPVAQASSVRSHPRGSGTVRFIEIPSGVPDTTARNAGIRRARGQFILSTDIDIAFSDELIRFLASRQLQKRRLYRIDCHEGNSVHAREGSFELSADGLRQNQAEDIAGVESGIHFGEGWYPAERDQATGEVFRWIENGAEVVLRVPTADCVLSLELEPGPGVAAPPHVLQVLDRTGAKVAEWRVAGRTRLQLWVPPEPGATMLTFRLSTPDGGRPLLDDLRILNFRFFHCDRLHSTNRPVPPGLPNMRPTLVRHVVSYARGGRIGALLPDFRGAVRLLRSLECDIFGAGIEYWGQGWHRLEESGTERFRWVSADAELVVRVERGPQDLCMLVEPGPSLHGRPFQLAVRLASGRLVGKVQVSGMTLVRVPLPLAVGSVTAIFLTPDSHGEALPGDSRVLNFRVLACACEPAKRPIAPADLESPAGWTAVTVSERPAGIDWAAKVKDHRRQLAEIGKPSFLHVNACDFILMDRELWFDLRGLPESDYPPAYLNTLFCYSAHFAGATEEVLREPLRIDRRPSACQAATAPDEDMIWLITQMRRMHAPAILNLDSWGFEPAYAAGSEE